MSAITLNKKANEVKLFLDTRIYNLDAVMEAAQAFTESCWVNLDSDIKDKVVVRITPRSKEIEIKSLGYEFFNYVLGLTQNVETD